ncbi:DISARM system helicase DrmA [Dictyobacter formicarum]|uniref:DISARM system helicase DrmA n=1 Tax=Dictyobacter formicarum TaxID=2778368 RepID=UPI0019155DF5|nr:DISARM system helicase DrmA [Dictyobacter formicarum]
METIRLGRDLGTPAELARLNKSLHAGEIRLDWRAVEPTITPEQLVPLLRGLDPSDHIEQLGGDTLSEALSVIVMDAFKLAADDREATVIGKPLEIPVTPRSTSRPELWLPEDEIVDIEEEIEEEVEMTNKVKAVTGKVTASQPELGPILQGRVPTPYEMRNELEDLLLRDLLGPAGGEEEEVDEFRVHDRYLVGILAPNETAAPAEELDSQGTIESGVEEHGEPDTDASQTTRLSPSSIGMSFCVDHQTTHIQLTARWGQYIKAESQVKPEGKSRSTQIWKRVPRGGQPLTIQLRAGAIERIEPEPDEQPEVYLKGLVRRSANFWIVTLFLVNGQRILSKRTSDSFYLFQPELSVAAPNGGPIFRRRPSELQKIYKDEDKALAMLYRKQVGFAIGHGVSVHAETLAKDPTCAYQLTTRFIPGYEVPRTEAPTARDLPGLAELCLDMRTLAQAERSELPGLLRPLLSTYSDWIAQQERRISDPREDLQLYQEAAHTAIAHCRRTLKRIQQGIDLISTDPQAASAFSFMNRAMWLQRIHTLLAEEKRRQSGKQLVDIDLPHNRSWRPFQLAFILLNIPALTDPTHEDRQAGKEALADLLWFPTGGGKTEAYLGLTAYTLGIRRLQDVIEGRSGEDGVAVIMRYTLRLLTLQQFQRAAALICACEIIRRGAPSTWGQTPFRLGLWVGQKSTPNTTDEAAEAITQAREASKYSGGGSGNPRQITHCPWCGQEIETGKDIIVESYEKGRGRTLTYCSDPFGACPFSRAKSNEEGIPVLVVDEEIYRLLPALLIATVDKFAQLPWKGETQMLFGQVDQRCERHGFRSPEIKDSDKHRPVGHHQQAHSYAHAPLRPPDLIIQDELHLISGPLGTLVGLYETAVDHLASWEVKGQRVRPKVIAATATIRQAGLQIEALFMRSVNIFPPQGLDVEDNFFSRQRQPGPDAPGRRYLGICANGRRMKAAQIRVYLSLLAGAQVLYTKYGAHADPWMTLVGYFNSMSELGGMRHLVDDDVSNRIWRMEQRGLANRSRPKVQELTSRVSSVDIPDVLSSLEQQFGIEGGPRPIDVLLATNMISVGVDVKRLGLMVVTGQPKTTSEYIQATSRVGRNAPGLVCTVYNWARPRDLSHYEQFEQYHATFYQHVEALSVTPFAPRALDRGLAALLVSIIRLTDQRFNKNAAAGQVSADPALIEQAIEVISQRAYEVAIESSERVKQDLQNLKDYWLKQANTHATLNYKRERNGMLNLLKEPQRGKWEPFTCLNSMRNVEPAVQLLIDERKLGDPNDLDTEEDTSEETN